jgi:hypothetical protein
MVIFIMYFANNTRTSTIEKNCFNTINQMTTKSNTIKVIEDILQYSRVFLPVTRMENLPKGRRKGNNHTAKDNQEKGHTHTHGNFHI